jgi:hypothetical protein
VNKQWKRMLYSTVDLRCLILILAPRSCAYGTVIVTAVVQLSMCELCQFEFEFDVYKPIT